MQTAGILRTPPAPLLCMGSPVITIITDPQGGSNAFEGSGVIATPAVDFFEDFSVVLFFKVPTVTTRDLFTLKTEGGSVKVTLQDGDTFRVTVEGRSPQDLSVSTPVVAGGWNLFGLTRKNSSESYYIYCKASGTGAGQSDGTSIPEPSPAFSGDMWIELQPSIGFYDVALYERTLPTASIQAKFESNFVNIPPET